MKFFFLIPARKNSKRVRNKNIININNKKLITYTFDSLKKLKIKNSKILLSTDSKEIINEVNKNYSFIDTHIRPKNLARDNSKLSSLIKFLKKEDYLNEFDYLILLSPCSPLRTYRDIKDFTKVVTNTRPDVLISVKELEKPLEWSLKLTKKKQLVKVFKKKNSLNKVFVPNGAFYAFNLKKNLNYDNFYSNKVRHYLMNRFKSLDIDVKDDLYQLKLYLKNELFQVKFQK